MISADNLCKQFGPRQGLIKLSGLNWIKIVGHSDYHQCQTVWTQIRPKILLDLIWVQGYQQLTLVRKQ